MNSIGIYCQGVFGFILAACEKGIEAGAGFSPDCRRASSIGMGAFNIKIIGERHKATIIADLPFDLKGERMRS